VGAVEEVIEEVTAGEVLFEEVIAEELFIEMIDGDGH